MIKQKLFKKGFAGALLAFLLLSSSLVFAQVKIGSNPTTISPSNNLEVEASTAGRKTSVDKTTGQVTIKDGTEGAAKVFTSDAVGGGSWQKPPTQNTDVWIYAKGVVSQSIPIGVSLVDYGTIVYDRANNFNVATDKITVPSAGIYQLSAGLRKNGYASGGFNIILGVFVNNVLHTQIYEDGWGGPATEPRATGALTLQLNAGDVVDFRIESNFATFFIGQAYLTFIKLSN